MAAKVSQLHICDVVLSHPIVVLQCCDQSSISLIHRCSTLSGVSITVIDYRHTNACIPHRMNAINDLHHFIH